MKKALLASLLISTQLNALGWSNFFLNFNPFGSANPSRVVAVQDYSPDINFGGLKRTNPAQKNEWVFVNKDDCKTPSLSESYAPAPTVMDDLHAFQQNVIGNAQTAIQLAKRTKDQVAWATQKSVETYNAAEKRGLTKPRNIAWGLNVAGGSFLTSAILFPFVGLGVLAPSFATGLKCIGVAGIIDAFASAPKK